MSATESKDKPRGCEDLRAHFGLHETPFTREIAIQDRWVAPHLDEPRAELRRTIEQRQSGAIIAPAGSGKTLVLRGLVDDLPEARYHVHYVKVTGLCKRDFCREIAAAVGISPVGAYPFLVRRLQEKFEASHADDARRPVLLVDEAHEMRPDVLGILRVLTNYDMDSRLVLSVVLSGQPPLARMLRSDELDALSQRLAHFTTLRLLSRAESRAYLTHRLQVAGGRTFLFDEHSVEALYEMTRGNLRAIDRLALKSLELAALAGHPAVDTTTVVAARARLGA
ncbi:MAG: AAA family ATPase [Polyangiaceae bacterium]|jgi:general secretion pathway protein A|nr:AAA family ATPase [Polyangiaceae bacterium]